MAFKSANQLLGDNDTYKVSSDIKRFTLLDMGFSKTNANNFAFERSLVPSDPYKGIRLKIVFKNDLKSFKISTISGNGLNKVNIFTNKNSDVLVEQYKFLMNNFVERSVFTKE